jgi:uncharacterized membrane protein (TIGR02234 family)
MTGRRGFLAALAGSALGGAVVLMAAGRVWGRAALPTVTGSVDHVSATGHAAEPALPALAIALLVLTAGVIAARGWLRRIIGLIVVSIGASVVALAFAARSDVAAELKHRAFAVAQTSVPAHTSGWAVVTALAGALAVCCGALTMLVGARWPALGARYDAAGARGRPGDTDLRAMSEWDALDRGEDPTV